jgi:hypothetical protein
VTVPESAAVNFLMPQLPRKEPVAFSPAGVPIQQNLEQVQKWSKYKKWLAFS